MWCLNQVRNPAAKSHDVGRQLAKASMKETQSVASLWTQRDRVVTDAERMEALRDRVIEKIPLEAMKEAIQTITYAALLLQYQGIEQRLRRTKELPALDKHKPGDKASSQGGGSQQHAKPKGQHAKDHNRRSSSSASQGSKPARTKPEGGDSGGKQKKPLSEIQCHDCKHALKRGTQWVDGDSHRACSHCTTRKQPCAALTNHHIELSPANGDLKFWAGCGRQQVLGRFIVFYYYYTLPNMPFHQHFNTCSFPPHTSLEVQEISVGGSEKHRYEFIV